MVASMPERRRTFAKPACAAQSTNAWENLRCFPKITSALCWTMAILLAPDANTSSETAAPEHERSELDGSGVCFKERAHTSGSVRTSSISERVVAHAVQERIMLQETDSRCLGVEEQQIAGELSNVPNRDSGHDERPPRKVCLGSVLRKELHVVRRTHCDNKDRRRDHHKL